VLVTPQRERHAGERGTTDAMQLVQCTIACKLIGLSKIACDCVKFNPVGGFFVMTTSFKYRTIYL